MTATTTDTVEHLDFEEALPCEARRTNGSRCDQPAKWIGRSSCPACSLPQRVASQLGCDDHYQRRNMSGLCACRSCGHIGGYADFWTIEHL